MRLKKLVLDGFKSFGRKTEFTFEPGITSIVGPNGCGKSNVVDAFRWVLGISSAKAVRGEAMTDMIFDGAARLARAQYAQVTLTFDNSDNFFHRIETPDVEISRKLGRDGKSQYYLNGEPCRLKDFKTLFQDTGIGVEAYSIIEQGKVDVLLSTDPTERRKIFEEAAGINRYKSQRHEAENRLKRAEQNLARLADILDEVKGQIRRVKTQATKAERWKEYTRELNALKTHRWLREYRTLHELREKWLVQATKAARELEDHEDHLDRERTRAQDAQAKYDDLMAEMNAIRGALHEAERKITGHETSLQAHRKRLEEIEDRRRRMRHARLVAESQKENFERRQKQATEQLDDLEREQQVHEQKFNALATREAELKGEIEAQLSAVRERQASVEALQRRRDTLGASIATLEADIRVASTDLEKLSRRGDDLETRIRELEHQRVELDGIITDARRRQQQLDERVGDAEGERTRLDFEIDELKETRQRIGEAVAADDARRSTLRELVENRSGVSAGSKELLDDPRLAERFRVRGTVADLLDVPEDLTAVVEAVLGPLREALVVANDEDAFAALDHLATHGHGGVQLLSSATLADVKAPKLNGNLPGNATPLDRLVKAGKDGKPLLGGLLGFTVLVDDLETAKQVLADLPADVGVATKNAEVLRRPAWFSGRPEAGGLFSVQAQLEQLETQINEKRAELDITGEKLQRLIADRDTAIEAVRQAQHDKHESSLEISELESERKHIERELESIGGEVHAASTDKEAAEEARIAAQDQLAEAKQTLQQVEAEHGQLASVNDDGDDLTDLQARHMEMQSELTDARVALAEINQRLVGHREALQHIEEGIRMNAADMERLDEEAGLLDDQEEESKEVIKTSATELETLRQTAHRHRAEQESREREVAVLRQQVATAQMNVEDALSRCEASRATLSEARHKEESCAERMHSLSERAQEELEVDLDELLASGILDDAAREAAAVAAEQTAEEEDSADKADEQSDAEDADADGDGDEEDSEPEEVDPVALIATMTDDEITDRIEELQEKIRRLGPVNLAALEELAELQEKHDFLAKEEEDLMHARNSIRKLVADIDSRTRRMFSETFELIRNNFQRIFRKLFNGGAADVYLTEPEDVLTSGIEIKARPPGSEPRTLTLLSGGQRSMIAIAMLFAIFEAKPSPFCILDEVDAALDDANTGRIGALLQEFTDRSQFLVITHSKATMSVADILYGITMQDQGVSKKIQIRFEQIHETADGEVEFDDSPDEPAVVA